MTAKEKSEQLKNEMDMVIYTDQNQDDQVKRCAFKVANNIWKELWNLYDNPNVSDSAEIIIKEKIDFWADVKAELS